MPEIKSLRLARCQEDATTKSLHIPVTRTFRRPVSFRMSSLKANLRRRTLDEFPMDHNCAGVARMSARRRQEKDVDKKNLASTHGESNQLKSYSRRRFETALTTSGKSLPPPSPEDKRIFWDDVQPTWTHRRHHSVSEHQTLTKPSTPLIKNRPGSEPAWSAVEGGNHRGNNGACRFNHLRGNNEMYPSIKRLLQESNAEYRVVSCVPNVHGDCWPKRRPSVDHSDVTDCYLVPKEEVCPEDVNHQVSVKEKTTPNVQQSTPEEDGSEHIDSVDESAEYIGDPKRMDAVKATHDNTQQKEDDDDEDDGNDEPSPPWRCWVDDATVSSICPDPETLDPTDDVTTVSPSPSAEDPAPDVSTLPVDTIADISASKNRLSVPGKLSRTSSASLDRRESATSPVPEIPVGKRKSSGRLKKKKGRKGTPEPPPVEVVELPSPPPPPPTPPIVEIVEEDPKEEEKEVELILPSYICPSSIAKSTEVEIKLWLRKSTFTGANRTLPILF